MLMHAIAHGGCEDTVRESALEADWEKIPCRTAGDSNPRQYCASRTLYQLSYLPPPIPLHGECNSQNSAHLIQARRRECQSMMIQQTKYTYQDRIDEKRAITIQFHQRFPNDVDLSGRYSHPTVNIATTSSR